MILNYSVSSLVRRLTNSVHLLILKSNPPFSRCWRAVLKCRITFSVSLVVLYSSSPSAYSRRAIGCNLTRYSFRQRIKLKDSSTSQMLFSRSSSDKLEMGRRAIGCCITRIMFSFRSSYISLLCLSHHSLWCAV